MINKYAIVVDGIVDNTADSDEDHALHMGWIKLVPGFGRGDKYDRLQGKFIKLGDIQAPPQPQIEPPTFEDFRSAIQDRLDKFAQTRIYDSMLSLCTYATSKVERLQKEGQRGVDLRDATWLKGYAIWDDVKEGKREVPARVEDILPELPDLTWED